MRVRCIVLVGLSGSGKSTIGARLAERLGWRFVDTDASVEARERRSIARVFEESGEAGFRAVEREVTARALALHDVVIATGGGWAAQPGALDALPDGTLAVWLRTRPGTAAARLKGTADRPLLRPDPLQALRRLERDRREAYGRAGMIVDTDERTVESLVEQVLNATGNE